MDFLVMDCEASMNSVKKLSLTKKSIPGVQLSLTPVGLNDIL